MYSPSEERKRKRHRLAIDVTPEQWTGLDRLVSWGTKSTLFRNIIDWLLSLEGNPKKYEILGALLTKDLDFEDVLIYQHNQSKYMDIRSKKTGRPIDQDAPFIVFPTGNSTTPTEYFQLEEWKEMQG